MLNIKVLKMIRVHRVAALSFKSIMHQLKAQRNKFRYLEV